MTNEQIIWNERVKLLQEGIIGDTGNEVVVKDENGKPKVLKEPEAIHTYQGWHEAGRQVRKGEHALCDCVIWKHTTKPAKGENEPDEEKLFRTKAYFFRESQTVAIDTCSQKEKEKEEKKDETKSNSKTN